MKGSTNIDDARRTSKVGRKVRAATARRDRTARSDEARTPPESTLGTLLSTVGAIGGLTGELASSALRLASRTRSGAARGVSRTPEQLRMMASAGESLRDIREVAGMTVREIVTALNLRDKSVWEAIEDGREVISFELILRLASLVARNDPLPFVLKYTRSYHPRLWGVLHELKVDQLSLQLGRERSFVNIYRRHDAARGLSDADFERVLQFTQQAFDLAMSLMSEASETVTPDSVQDDAVDAPGDEEQRPARQRRDRAAAMRAPQGGRTDTAGGER